VTENSRQKKARGYIEDYNAQHATQFMADCHSSGEPFFLFYCTQVPHMNHEFDWPARAETLTRYDPQDMPIPQTWQDDLEGKPPYLKAARSREQALHYGYDQKESIQRHFQRYYATITEMDAALGPVLGAMDELSLREDTHVFLMGDNGWFMGEHGFTSKVLPYEESIRVPMLAAGPGIRTGLNSRLVLNIDIPPTILELAGLPIPESMHGASLVPLLRDKPCRWRTSFLCEAPTPSLGSWPLCAVRTQRWKYIQTFDKTDRKHLAFEELYDLHADPHETTNLAGRSEQAERQATLKRELRRLRESLRP
jgi:arylsulfatase A-like enzyme